MRRRLLLASIWVAGTTVAIVLSVSAVGMVGRSVAGRDTTLVSPSRVVQELAATTTTTNTVEAGLEGELGPAVDPFGTPPDPQPAPSGDGSSAAARVDVDESNSEAGSSAATGGPSLGLAPAAVEEVYDTKGGTVGVRCTGATIALLYATPVQGWGIHDAATTGPVEVEVRFEPATDAHGTEVRVRVNCQGGTPVEEIREN